MAKEEDAEIGDTGAVNAAIRSAKKAARPTKIGSLKRPTQKPSPSKPSKKRSTKKGSNFDRDLGQKTRNEGVRATKGDKIGGMGKKLGRKKEKR